MKPLFTFPAISTLIWFKSRATVWGRSMLARVRVQAVVLAVTLLITSLNSQAASGTWLDTGPAGTPAWSSPSNWSGGVVPNVVTGNTDITTFNTGVGAVGTSSNPVTLTSAVTITRIVFDTANVGAFTIGTPTSSTLTFQRGGITMNSTVLSTETFAGPIGDSGTNGQLQFINNAVSNTALLNITGSITLASGQSLALFGSNTGTNTISGAINGSGAGLEKTGAGTWVLTNANGYTGGTTLAGGNLVLDFSASGAPSSNIINSVNGLNLGAGGTSNAASSTLTITGSANTANTQTLGNVGAGSPSAAGRGSFHINLNPGNSGTVALNLGTLPGSATQGVAGITIDFGLPSSSASVLVGTASATLTSSSSGLFANAITINGNDFATNQGNAANQLVGLSTIVGGYSNATTITTGLSQALDVSGNTAVSNSLSIPAIRFNQAAADTITITSTKALTVGTNGAILVTSNVGANQTTITGGSLSGQNSRQLALIQNNTAGILEVDSAIINNNGATALTKAGAGLALLTGVNTYTGVNYINEGTLQFQNEVSLYNDTTTSWTAANINVATGATLAVNVGGAGQFTSTDLDTLQMAFAAGTAVNGMQAGSTLGLDTTNAGGNFTYNSVISDTSAGTHSIGLAKLGTGALTLTNANTYTGGTQISGGTLAVDNSNGSGTGTGAVQVKAGALSGNGTISTSGVAAGIAVDVAAGASITPSGGVTTGFSHLTLNLQSGTSVTLEAGSKFAFNLGASTATSDEVLVTGGSLALNGQQFGDFTWNAQGTLAAGTYTLFDSTGGITGALGASLTGSLDGGLYNGTLFKSGNDIDLMVVANVPEPSTWALMLGGFALLVVFQRAHRSKNS